MYKFGQWATWQRSCWLRWLNTWSKVSSANWIVKEFSWPGFLAEMDRLPTWWPEYVPILSIGFALDNFLALSALILKASLSWNVKHNLFIVLLVLVPKSIALLQSTNKMKLPKVVYSLNKCEPAYVPSNVPLCKKKLSQDVEKCWLESTWGPPKTRISLAVQYFTKALRRAIPKKRSAFTAAQQYTSHIWCL